MLPGGGPWRHSPCCLAGLFLVALYLCPIAYYIIRRIPEYHVLCRLEEEKRGAEQDGHITAATVEIRIMFDLLFNKNKANVNNMVHARFLGVAET